MAIPPSVSPGETSATMDGERRRAALWTAVWPMTVGMSPSATIAAPARADGGSAFSMAPGVSGSAHPSVSAAPAYTSAAYVRAGSASRSALATLT
jgi:hypothetical protein